ncbi:MAG: S49 family peptidase [Prevotellaceae bacterium]|jgi:protease-4|nr:S49 family peptidase [Prevotellaceae bacterium]
MSKILKNNWQFHLANSLMRGNWFIDPQFMTSQAEIVVNLLNKKEINISAERAEYDMLWGNGTAIYGIREEWKLLPKNSVAIFPIKGTMFKEGTWCSYGTEEIEQYMKTAAAQSNIVGAVLTINSPGGEVSAVAPMHRGIKAFKEAGKPVVSTCDTCMSAAYYAAIETDLILADNDISADFGSIGVMSNFIDAQQVYEKQGYVFHRIKAEESADKNVAFEKALKGDYEMLKSEALSPLAIKFQNDVKQARGAKLNLDTSGILNGKTFYAKKALEVGLIDGFGDINKAVQLVIELS